ncbi:hypothetical protein Cpa01nite_19510 [Cellulomonas pakistanensis]|uniref:Uncharacterized protein n=1 Tax=Cellulomonas pakistanensis TaxID=992287 RepID=A0A919P902_9CELL|nr:hypothetical protein Cpa01nite_19510 [Cellulomonas pakistanensis]
MDRYDREIEEQVRRRDAMYRRPEVQREVARLRVSADERLGLETPQWIRDLAERPLPPRGRSDVPAPFRGLGIRGDDRATG